MNKCLLVVPLAGEGWNRLSDDHLMMLYNQIKSSVFSRQRRSIWGRGGTLWCWEVILFAVGYEDGAEYVSRVQIAYPGFLAASALVNGHTTDFSSGERLSTHWLIPDASEDYQKRNCEIPVQVWLYTNQSEKCLSLAKYWNRVNDADTYAEESIGGLLSTVAFSAQNPAHQVRIFTGEFHEEPELAQHIFPSGQETLCGNGIPVWFV